MKKWNQAMNNMTFEGKENVMARIESDLVKKESLFSKVSRFLDLELEIPVTPVVAFIVSAVMILSIQFTSIEERQYQYTITVVNQWGHYENY